MSAENRHLELAGKVSSEIKARKVFELIYRNKLNEYPAEKDRIMNLLMDNQTELYYRKVDGKLQILPMSGYGYISDRAYLSQIIWATPKVVNGSKMNQLEKTRIIEDLKKFQTDFYTKEQLLKMLKNLTNLITNLEFVENQYGALKTDIESFIKELESDIPLASASFRFMEEFISGLETEKRVKILPELKRGEHFTMFNLTEKIAGVM